MATEIIRVNQEDHAWIMEWGNTTKRSASEIIAYWVRKQKSEMGEVVIGKSERKPTRKPYPRPYDLTIEQMRRVPARVPTPIKPLEKVKEDARIAQLPYEKEGLTNLADGVGNSDTPRRQPYWMKCTHLMTYVVSRIGGTNGIEIRTEAFPLLVAIKDWRVVVHEETPGIFIPVSETADTILRICTMNNQETKQEKEYFSCEDLWMLWGGGFEIIYQDNIL